MWLWLTPITPKRTGRSAVRRVLTRARLLSLTLGSNWSGAHSHASGACRDIAQVSGGAIYTETSSHASRFGFGHRLHHADLTLVCPSEGVPSPARCRVPRAGRLAGSTGRRGHRA